ncbi:MAG: 23S rRNA (guanosine(2251)-2'-O)-methyltransferase RlmB [Thermoanaerobaculia bacterium]|nr:23S rRNA (guanosine(2251)-2'-O)-methyltransferase RlmB [Thermoanaerobaculia bacterium]
MVLYGYHSVRELLRHRPHETLRVLTAARRGSPRRKEIEDLCGKRGVALSEVAEAELRRLAGSAEHNGFLAETRVVPTPGMTVDRDLRVLVEDVQDPRNLGALLRVCEGAGVGEVLVRDRGSAPLSATVVKTSAGASEWLDVRRVTNSSQAVEELKSEGFWVFGAAAGGVPPWEVDLTGSILLCFGGEQKGLRTLTRQRCDRLVGVPMRGRVESLNLATAAAAVLYEAVRQRLRLGGDSR